MLLIFKLNLFQLSNILCEILILLTEKHQFVSVLVTIYSSGFGITAGVHRLWSHRAYRARLPLRIVLALLFTITGQVRNK